MISITGCVVKAKVDKKAQYTKVFGAFEHIFNTTTHSPSEILEQVLWART